MTVIHQRDLNRRAPVTFPLTAKGRSVTVTKSQVCQALADVDWATDRDAAGCPFSLELGHSHSTLGKQPGFSPNLGQIQ